MISGQNENENSNRKGDVFKQDFEKGKKLGCAFPGV